MIVAFRADASIRIGTGHVIRCRTLARKFRETGNRVVFICREIDGNLNDDLRIEGFEVFGIDQASSKKSPTHASGRYAPLDWSQGSDANLTAAALGSLNVDWLVVDHYGISAEWHTELRKKARRMLVIDDLGNRDLNCDLLLDQNLSERLGDEKYAGLLPRHCQGLFGPKFALLSPVYAKKQSSLRPRYGRVERVLISMGGSDICDATGTAVKCLSASELRHLQLDVVVGANYRYHERLASLVERRGNGRIRGPLDDLVSAMEQADFAIGAGGTTSWERLCLGLPSLIVSLADNQEEGCRALDRIGAAIYAGPAKDVDLEALRTLLHKTIFDRERLSRMSQIGLTLVDGQGATRVAERMVALT